MDETLESELSSTRNTLSADRLDMSFGELINMYDSGELIIDPEFQRYFRWDIYQRTRFVESILLGIPVPSIFMAEDSNGKWEVVDGLQRISTILSFFGKLTGDNEKENGWVMCQGDLINSLEGKSIDDLPLKFQLNIKRSSVRIEVIKWDSRYDMRYELFNRLNTGGSPLTDQEVRNCIFRAAGSGLSKEIRELSANMMLNQFVRPTERQKSELYLDELVLRFYALLWSSSPSKNLGEHLTEYMKEASVNPTLYVGKRDLLERTLRVLSEINNNMVFQGANHQFSPSKFDGIMIGIANNLDFYEKNIDDAAQKISTLDEDGLFKAASGVASNSRGRVTRRIARALEIFTHE
ncbi:MAG: DUF262 domain-containing protein [Proteobacteria bacterium]|nr:DUF262 domain-containing protein [Pseudomonadota bacterium]MBU4297731.1 DUF262 domain-containing protein [Pseudomonadota bacterium]MCG2749608.1 DUF262 domain-containing protein [Desulfobulbaceae bacterium]